MEKLNYVEKLNTQWHKLMKLTESKEIEQKYKEFKELSTVEIGIISMVYHKPDIIFRDICDELDLPKSTLTNIIDRLEKWGYLKRTISQRDRRSYGIELTEKGFLIQKEHTGYEYDILSRLLNALDTDEEKKTFLNLMDKIIGNLESKNF